MAAQGPLNDPWQNVSGRWKKTGPGVWDEAAAQQKREAAAKMQRKQTFAEFVAQNKREEEEEKRRKPTFAEFLA